MGDYRDLRVWQMAMTLAKSVYDFARGLPAMETYALGDQLRRAAVSVPANLAEGQARGRPKEFLHFACIARGSLAELQTLLTLAEQVGYLPADRALQMQVEAQAVRAALYGLTSSLRRRLPTATKR